MTFSYTLLATKLNLYKIYLYNIKLIYLTRFPKEETRKMAWIKAMGLCAESLPKFPLVMCDLLIKIIF